MHFCLEFINCPAHFMTALYLPAGSGHMKRSTPSITHIVSHLKIHIKGVLQKCTQYKSLEGKRKIRLGYGISQHLCRSFILRMKKPVQFSQAGTRKLLSFFVQQLFIFFLEDIKEWVDKSWAEHTLCHLLIPRPEHTF